MKPALAAAGLLAAAASFAAARASILMPQRDAAGGVHFPTFGGTFDVRPGVFTFTRSSRVLVVNPATGRHVNNLATGTAVQNP